MDKERRREIILQLLEQEDISNQEFLRQELRKAGFDVTQATLSRDLRELNVIKATTPDGLYKYAVIENFGIRTVSSCEVSGNILVLKTEAGMAPAVAYRIDEMEIPGIMGTVAGEDTLLAVVAEGYDGRQVRKELWKRVQEL